MTAPGTFSNKVSTSGHHLVLTGANGEPVVVSENHPNQRGSKDSLEVIVRTVVEAVDGIGRLDISPEVYIDEIVQQVTDQLWNAQP